MYGVLQNRKKEVYMDQNTIPVSEKFLLTIREASEYFNIGIKYMSYGEGLRNIFSAVSQEGKEGTGFEKTAIAGQRDIQSGRSSGLLWAEYSEVSGIPQK